jgi:hypothetical protein
MSKSIGAVVGIISLFLLAGCKLTNSHPSKQLMDYESQKGAQKNMGQVRFVLDSLGTLNLQGLIDGHIMPTKVYNTALILAEEKENKELGVQGRQDINRIMQEYGFVIAPKIANWNSELAVEPQLEDPVGYLSGMVEEEILGIKTKIQLSNVNCSACHSGVEYLADGRPTNNVWLGAPNTSINFDGYLGQIYRGLKLGMKNKTTFMKKLESLYPEIDRDEKKTITKFLLPKVDSVLEKMSKMNRVFPFENGGPGITNGVAAFKNDAHLFFKQFDFHKEENGFVAVPNISLRGFRSSLTVDGAYGHVRTSRYFEVNEEKSKSQKHLDRLAELANFFTFSAMGAVEQNLRKSIPQVKEIFSWLKDMKSQKFPLPIDEISALKGSSIFQNKCSACHGTYSAGIENVHLLSFPNKLVPQAFMGTDPRRWQLVSADIQSYAQKTSFAGYVNASVTVGGYVAPILSGLWSSAPYFHNGSVPTLKAVLYPELRPHLFEYGGHVIDMDNIGVLLQPGETGKMVLAGEHRKMRSQVYDTSLEGRSNRGHENQFSKLTSEEKEYLLEYLKLL